MKFFSIIPLLAAAIVAAQDNSFSQPQPGDELKAGDAFVIRWNATTDGQVALVLLQGKSDNLSPVLTISEGLENRGAVRWLVPSDLPDGDNYALRINPVGKADDINYTGQFKISGGKVANTTSEAAAEATSSSSANSSSSADATSSASAVVPVTSGANSSTTVPVASTVANSTTEISSTEAETSTASAVTTNIVGAGVSNGTGATNGTANTRSGAASSQTTLTSSGRPSRSSGSATAASATGSAGASASRAPTNGGVVNSQNLGLVGVAAGIAALMM